MNPLRSSENTGASSVKRNDEQKSAKPVEAAMPNPFGIPLLETILAHMEQGVVVYDANLTLVVFNRRYVELLDFPPA